MTTKTNPAGAAVQETATAATSSTQQAAYYMHNDMKFALAPSTPPPAADLPFTFTHVAHDGTKTTTTFDPLSKPSAPKWAQKGVAPARAVKEKDDGERTLLLRKRGGGRGRGGRGGRGVKP
ncbi:unnamed protein product [Zymoseptoria tritici ST99CH_1E4]|uniref:Uncharacterized protein n=1 Tax=Zymoseptoria tritici ST99CH_1E4 TaxID=1276532 RepID=A0A2H1GQ06_ZYMTR|nr:unnamed protein product [Zymoseptoria tritici ST99CH_1E4]